MKNFQADPIFVVFEGLDGTGKSTCAKRTAEVLGARYLTTPSVAMRKYRDEIITSYGKCQEAAQMYYLSAVMDASLRVKGYLDAGESVVLDRYFLSTQVYAEFRGSALDIESAVEMLLLPAHWTVLLCAPLNVRRARTNQRGSSAADTETLTIDADRELSRGYERRAQLPVTGKMIRVDASPSVEEIVMTIVTNICHPK